MAGLSPGEGKVEEADTIDLESAQFALWRKTQPLSVFFAPESVAVFGANESMASIGRKLLLNLMQNRFEGKIYSIGPELSGLPDIPACPDILSLSDKVDLAVVATPAESVPGIIADCGKAGVRGAIILSAGFRESGEKGAKLEDEIKDHARRAGIRIIGPNCLGVMSPINGLNVTYAGAMARPGNVAFISQSGALCSAVLDWSLREMVGFSSFVSVGSMVDVGWGDLIDYFGDDPRTRSILIYMESIGDARSFLSAAREVALSKPIIVIKAGRHEASAKAAASHTGAMTGCDDVLEAAFRRCGVLRVNSLSDLFYMAEVLAKQPRPKGPRLTILTNAGGPGVLAADALLANGGSLAELSPNTMEALDKLLPPNWSHNNPVDILGDASPERYSKAVEIISRDSNSDGLLVIVTPQLMTEPRLTAEHLTRFARMHGKPVLASWMGGAEVAEGKQILNRSGIPTFSYPDAAACAFDYMWRYSYSLRSIYETPSAAGVMDQQWDRALVGTVIQTARRAGRTILNEPESKKILTAYGIPTVETRVASNEEQALKVAREIGFPVVLKLTSDTITHKARAGGVEMNLQDEAAVLRAYRKIESSVNTIAGPGHFLGVTVQPMIGSDGFELIFGSSLDPQFGPVLLFGSGGSLVEIYADRALGLPPLNTTLARRIMERTRIHTAFGGAGGKKPVDINALEQLFVQFSQLVVDHAWIKEIEINPLLVSGSAQVALDARVVLHGPDVTEESILKPVIRPYPAQYAGQWSMRDGTPLVIRPIRPEDEPLMVRFHETLSDRSVYYRYFHHLRLNQRIAHERLVRMCFIDYEREIALVAVREDLQNTAGEIVGVGRLIKLHGGNDAEFAVVIGDRWQRQGLGTELLRRLVVIGRSENLGRIVGDILPDNADMLHICEKLGFRRAYSSAVGAVKAEIELGAGAASSVD